MFVTKEFNEWPEMVKLDHSSFQVRPKQSTEFRLKLDMEASLCRTTNMAVQDGIAS